MSEAIEELSCRAPGAPRGAAAIPGALDAGALASTAATLAETQLPSGLIPWSPGGHADPWNHVEAAMALAACGRRAEADAAYDWLAGSQLRDGSWCRYYLARGVEDPRRDTNVVAYVATGVWQHWRTFGDPGFVSAMWPVVDRAIDFALRYQREDGAFAWAVDPDGTAGSFALLTGSSSLLTSLRAACRLAEVCEVRRPAWAEAERRLRTAIVARPSVFADKARWAMDWYYPVLCGALGGEGGHRRLRAGRPAFVLDGFGVRCVQDRVWVTAAETAEYALALDVAGQRAAALEVLWWLGRFRREDGRYWTGLVPQEDPTAVVSFPGGEATTYSAAAVVLAAAALTSDSAGGDVFRELARMASPPGALPRGNPPAVPSDSVGLHRRWVAPLVPRVLERGT